MHLRLCDQWFQDGIDMQLTPRTKGTCKLLIDKVIAGEAKASKWYILNLLVHEEIGCDAPAYEEVLYQRYTNPNFIPYKGYGGIVMVDRRQEFPLNEYLQNGAVSRPDMRDFVNSVKLVGADKFAPNAQLLDHGVTGGWVECEDMKAGSVVKLIVDALLQHFLPLAGRRIETAEA
ncbi:hypothetical protein Tco_1329579 [Tanacetum coccineum]